MFTDIQRIEIDRKYSALAKSACGERIREMLESHPLIQPDLDKLWLTGTVYNKAASVIYRLACWYMWFEDEYGEESTNKTLSKYLSGHSVRTTFCVWVYGIKPEQRFDFEGISIVPINDMPKSRERSEYLDLISKHESPVSYCAIVKEQDIPRIVECDKEANKVHSELVNSSYVEISDLALLVNALSDLSCLPNWRCSSQQDLVPFGPWSTSGRSSVCFDIVGNHSRAFSQGHGVELNQVYKSYKGLSGGKKAWLNTILDRIRKSKRQQSIENKVLDLGIAAEMLLLRDLTENDPISFPFRFRGSWLLGNDFDSRKSIHRTLKNFYGYRCAIAHEGAFKKEKDIKEVQEMLPELYDIVEKIFKRAVLSSYPSKSDEWLELILGNKECGYSSKCSEA